MTENDPSPLDPLIESQPVREAARALVSAVRREAAGRRMDAPSYRAALREIERLRGSPLLYPLLSGGTGEGAWLRLAALRERLPNAVGASSGMGAMRAFVPWHGSAELAGAAAKACFEEGLILLCAGAEPTRLRMLPPVDTREEELAAAFGILEKALRRVAEQRELPC